MARQRDRETAGERRAIDSAIKAGTSEIRRKADEMIGRYQERIKRQRDTISRLTEELLAVRGACTCGAAERLRVTGMESMKAEQEKAL